jgi:hypothetical protein
VIVTEDPCEPANGTVAKNLTEKAELTPCTSVAGEATALLTASVGVPTV